MLKTVADVIRHRKETQQNMTRVQVSYFQLIMYENLNH